MLIKIFQPPVPLLPIVGIISWTTLDLDFGNNSTYVFVFYFVMNTTD